jgi:hypothetical protein
VDGLADELRGTPIQVEIDAVLILRGVVHAAVS